MTSKKPEDLTNKTYQKIAKAWSNKHFDVDYWEREIDILLELKLIDVGCGYGRDYPWLTKRKYQYLGFDKSSEMIKIAREQNPKGDFRIHDMYAMSELGSFDVVWAMASLLHIPKSSAPQVLDEYKKALFKDGLLVVSLKEGSGGESIEYFEYDKRYPRLFVYWQEDEFRTLLKQKGFRIIKITRREVDRPWRWVVFFATLV